MKLLSEQVVDTLLTAVDTVVKGRLRDLKYDKTIECQVVSDKQKKDGIYVVEYDGGQFSAYGQSTDSYYVNDTVYVNIPQGDFTKQKLIIGRKVSDKTPTQTYTLKLPFDDFIGLQHLAPNIGAKESGFLANKPEDGWTEENTSNGNLIWQWNASQQSPMVNNKLGISMDVQSLLAQYRPLRGKYGLRIEIDGIGKTTERDPSKEKSIYVMFTNDDMYGNSYAFSSPFTQQKIFDISEFMVLTGIKIYFWQDFSFADEQNTPIPYTAVSLAPDGVTANYSDMPSNLILANLEVYLGLTSADIDDEKVLLYTYDDVYFGRDYESQIARDEKDTRTLQCAWVHKQKDGSYLLIDTLDKLNKQNAHIYWYFNKYGAQIDGTIPAQRFGGINWQYLEELTDDFTYKTLLDISKNTQKYKVIVHHDNTFDVSDTLVFTNVVPVEDVQESLDANSEIVFRMLKKKKVWKEEVRNSTTGELTGEIKYHEDQFQTVSKLVDPLQPQGERYDVIVDKSNEWKQQFTLVEDNTLNNFFVYDENNRCIKNEDKEYWSSQYFYLQIWIRNNEDGSYVPLMVGNNYDDPGFDVKWKLPDVVKSKTMFQAFAEISASDKEFASLVPGFLNMSDDKNFIAQAKKITRKFSIADYWDVLATNNTIEAVISRNGRTYTINRTFLFGQSGSTGSDYTVVISQDFPEGSSRLLANSMFRLKCQVFDQWGNDLADKVDPVNNTKLNTELFQINWTLIGPSKITKTREEPISDISSWEISKSGGYLDNVISGYIRTDVDGRAFPPIFRVAIRGAAAYTISAVKGFQLVSTSDVFTNYSTDCPSRIEYKSDGTVPIYNTSEFQVQDVLSTLLLYPEWNVLSYQKKASSEWILDLNKTYADLNKIVHPATEILTNSGKTTIPAYSTYRLKIHEPYFWTDSMSTDLYLCLEWADGNKWMRQSIALDMNIYSSSLINAWDGTLNIDKEHNSILARMLSAGTKDSNNRFTGVMLGDWKDNADVSLDGSGLYGLINGRQSFGFKTDGTGFVGLASSGQITFDGNKALISSADKAFYINLNPIKYDIDSLLINSHNYSPYFLYAQTKKTANTDSKLLEIYNSTTGAYDLKTQWTDKYVNDLTHDYFIVDPNNGVLASGGIIAKYGRIGNWYITSEGLVQKNSNEHKFMYLGYSPFDKETLNENVLVVDPESATLATITIPQAEDRINSYNASYNSAIATAQKEHDLDLAAALIVYREQAKNPQALLPDFIKQPIDQEYRDAVRNEKNRVEKLTNSMNAAIQIGINSYTSSNRYCIFAGSEEFNNSVFSVKWDGTMQARKGIIGKNNPWFISDVGLTQQKNSGIIYLGSPEMGDENNQITSYDNTYEEPTIVKTTSDPMDSDITIGWEENKVLFHIINNGAKMSKNNAGIEKDSNYIILAAGKLNTLNATSPTINFGVTRKGFLFSQAGRIGGWNITQNTLQHITPDKTSSIVFDTANNCLNFNNGVTVIYGDGRIELGNYNDGQTTGSIYLANFLVTGTSNGSISYKNAENITGSNKNQPFSANNIDSFYWQYKIDLPTNNVYTTSNVTESTLNVGSVNTLKFLDLQDNLSPNTGTGIVLATGYIYQDGVKTPRRTVMIYPVGHDATTMGAATLGYTNARWNLYGDYVSANVLSTSSLQASGNIFMGSNLVATQLWVYNQLSDVYASIESSGSGSASGIKGAWGGINNTGEQLYKIFNGRPFVEFAYPRYYDGELTVGSWRNIITYFPLGKGGIGDDVNCVTGEFKALEGIKLTAQELIYGGRYSTKTIAWAMGTHTHDLSLSVTTSGVVSGSVGMSNLDGSAASSSFKISDTIYFKKYAATSIGLTNSGISCIVAARNGAGNTITNYSSGEDVTTRLTLSISNGKVNLLFGGSTVASISIKNLVDNAYQSGWNDGYNDGINSASHSPWVEGPYRDKNGKYYYATCHGVDGPHQYI